jgi:RNA polymerase sigma factor (sigma-70 family)
MSGTVFLVDDDTAVLNAVARLIRSAGYNVETFASPRDFLKQPHSDEPGCLVLDLRMPELNGLELQDTICRAGWGLPVIFMSGHADVRSTVAAIKGGAIDFLLKPFDEQQLLEAIDRAIALDCSARFDREERKRLRARLMQLTPREHQVCARVLQGRLNKEIASDLGISEKTVKAHRAQVMKKLQARSVAELVRIVDNAREDQTSNAILSS